MHHCDVSVTLENVEVSANASIWCTVLWSILNLMVKLPIPALLMTTCTRTALELLSAVAGHCAVPGAKLHDFWERNEL